MSDRKPRILAFAGSARRGSLNQRLAEIAAGRIEAMGGSATVIAMSDYEMPLYNGDLESKHGLPDAARRFKQALVGHDGFLIASPEYNGCFTPLLKNALDWASRRETGDSGPLLAYRGKTAALVGASNGRLGGLRGLALLRPVLTTLGVHVVPDQLAVAGAGKLMWAEDGTPLAMLADETFAKMLDGVCRSLVETTRALTGK